LESLSGFDWNQRPASIGIAVRDHRNPQHDRAGTDNFQLTREFLAELLCIQRPSVTIVARALQKARLIRYSRGLIAITDREGLEKAACECYGMVRRAMNATHPYWRNGR
jgi:hypothetical protein